MKAKSTSRTHDLFYVLDRLHKKAVNPRFLSLIHQTYLSTQTLTPELLRDFRRVCYRHLRIWFTADWTESIPTLTPAPYSRCPRLKGDPDIAHIFYRTAQKGDLYANTSARSA
jgi:hypothetical protein